jgi:hypothetical protein
VRCTGPALSGPVPSNRRYYTRTRCSVQEEYPPLNPLISNEDGNKTHKTCFIIWPPCLAACSRRLQSKIRGLVMAPALFALVAGISPMAQAQDEQSGLSASTEGSPVADNRHGLASPIEGSWLFAIDIIGQGITFNSLISFTAGGVVVTSPSLPPPQTLYGSWKQSEPNRFNATFYGFILDPAGTVAMNKANLLLHLTGRNELAGTAVGYTCDLQAENCVKQGDIQFTGKRIVPE